MIYAPIDLAVMLSEGLARRGHQIDFYGPLGTTLAGARVETGNLRPLIHNQQEFRALLDDSARMNHYVPALWDKFLVNKMLARAKRGEYDLLHFHHPEVALDLAAAHKDVPIVYTLHDPVYPWYKELFEIYSAPNQHYVSISNNQRRDAPDLPYAATVYNGVDLQRLPYGAEPEDYLLIAGRVVPEKGIKEAVQIAQQTGDRLLIIGPVYPDSQDYFDQYIKPHLSDQILYLGFIEQNQMGRYYQKAKALLTPVQWEEPFGLTTIEAMACGTPVISLRRGAAPEIIRNGKTGFLANSVAEMVAAVGKIPKIDRAGCRAEIKQRFSIEKMIDGYEAAFEKILRRSTPARKSKTFVAQKLLKGSPAKTLRKIRSALPATPDDDQTGLELAE